jgi:hypothetical protein
VPVVVRIWRPPHPSLLCPSGPRCTLETSSICRMILVPFDITRDVSQINNVVWGQPASCNLTFGQYELARIAYHQTPAHALDAESMSSAAETITFTTSIPKHKHSRSATDATQRPEVYHSASYSLDNSSLTSGTERDTLSSTSSPPKPAKPTKPTKPSILPLRKHKRADSGPVKSPTIPIFHKQKSPRDAPTVPTAPTAPTAPDLLTAPLPSPLLLKSSSKVTIDGRLPVLKRAPASHSSYGIATSCGPPPSFSTQRTLSQDRPWKPAVPDKIDAGLDASTLQPTKVALVMGEHNSIPASSPTSGEQQMESTPSEDAAKNPPGTLDEADASESPVTDEHSKGPSIEDRKSEDLFLTMAKDSEQQQVSHNGTRRSRTSLPFISNTGITIGSREERPRSSRQAQNDIHTLSHPTDVPAHHNKRLSLGWQTSTASAHPLDETWRQRYFSSAAKATSATARSTLGRDEVTERPKYFAREATDSTISTTAPSTVWDELDDLKSRIKKLELTGKLPSSSAAAMSSAAGERPRTATTNATTMSASPKYPKASISPADSAIDGVPSTVHPLLHEALNKARSVVSQDIYQKLAATASDALQLAAMMNGNSQPSNASSTGMVSSSERQIRRRADSMCRGLTELAIALSADARPLAQPARPASRETTMMYHSPITSAFADRRLSSDPEDQTAVAARLQSRIATRRTSNFNNSSRTAYSSPEPAVHATSTALPQMPPTSSSRLNGTSMLLRNRRAYGLPDGAANEVDSSPANRPPSRAMTEIARGTPRRYSPRDQVNFSKEYSNKRPMSTAFEDPDDAQASPSVTALASGLVSRRVSGSPANRITSAIPDPVTPREGFGRRFGLGTRRESSVPLSSAENTPENVTIERGSGSRRTSGLASRIGSSVGSRLRAVRPEKYINVKEPQNRQQSSQREIAELQQESEKLRLQQTEPENASAYGER